MAVALVTGAARPRGIGRATALRLADAGPRRGVPRHRPRVRRGADARHGDRATTSTTWSPRSKRSAGGRSRCAPTCRTRTRSRQRWPRPPTRSARSRSSPTSPAAAVPASGSARWLMVPAPEFRGCSTSTSSARGWCRRRARSRMVAAGVGGRDLQRVEPGRQAGLPDARRLLRGEGRRDPAHADDGHRARPVAASASTPSARAPSTPTSSTRTAMLDGRRDAASMVLPRHPARPPAAAEEIAAVDRWLLSDDASRRHRRGAQRQRRPDDGLTGARRPRPCRWPARRTRRRRPGSSS